MLEGSAGAAPGGSHAGRWSCLAMTRRVGLKPIAAIPRIARAWAEKILIASSDCAKVFADEKLKPDRRFK